MQEQNRKLYRWLRDSEELDAFLEMKAREASRMYLAILREGPQPPTLPMEREAEERVRAEMFQFPDDLMMATQEVEPENEDVSSPAKIGLARKTERSESKDPAMLIGLIDEPGMFDPIETWKHFLAEVEAMPDSVQKPQTILHAEHMIALKEEELVPMPSNLPFMVALIDEPGPFGNNLSEWQQFLAQVEQLPDSAQKRLTVNNAKQMIAMKLREYGR